MKISSHLRISRLFLSSLDATCVTLLARVCYSPRQGLLLSSPDFVTLLARSCGAGFPLYGFL